MGNGVRGNKPVDIEKKEKAVKIGAFLKNFFAYFVLSYFVALISIGVMVLMRIINGEIISFVKIFDSAVSSIIFSTNACYLVTTQWSIASRVKQRGLFLCFIGSLLCLALNTLTIVYPKVPNEVYLASVLVTLAICLIHTRIYIDVCMNIDEKLEEYDNLKADQAALDMIHKANETGTFTTNDGRVVNI